jgi:RHS repeat-associated protein
VWDGMAVLQERDGANAVKVTYTRGLDLSGSMQGAGGIGGLLARTDSSGTAYYHSDAGGNVTTMTDSSGNVVARYLYDPFGNLLAKSGPLADVNTYRFSSKEVHPNSGLYYYGYRFYEPNLQRWVNPDPIGIRGGMNLYGFVGNNPMNGVDALGLSWYYPQWFENMGDGIVGGLGYNFYNGTLETGGRMALDDMVRAHTDFGKYKDWNRDWRERHGLPNESETAGCTDTIGAVGKLTGGSAELYLGMTTSRVPGASGAGTVGRAESTVANVVSKAKGVGGIVKGEANCVQLAMKFDARLRGIRNPDLTGIAPEYATLPQVEKNLGQKFKSASSIDEISAALAENGPGSQALVVGHRSDGLSHMFNGVVNSSGEVKFWNHQAGAAQDSGLFDSGFDFLITK